MSGNFEANLDSMASKIPVAGGTQNSAVVFVEKSSEVELSSKAASCLVFYIFHIKFRY